VTGESQSRLPLLFLAPYNVTNIPSSIDCGDTLKVLVTGGAGFIGSNFVEMALSGQFPAISKVVVLDKLTYAGKISNLSFALENPNFNFIHGDICDPELVSNAMLDVNAVINFAAESHVDRSINDSAEFIKTNIVGTHVLLEAARQKGLLRFIQISTDEVYGSIESGSWDENSPLLPNSPYSASKAAADLLVRSYFITHNLNVNITRCSNNFGPRQYPEKIIPLFISNLINGRKIPLYGSGENVRDWLYVTDHCEAIYKVLTSGTPGEIYNVGGGTELTNLSLTKKLLDALGNDMTSIEFVSDRLGHDFRYSVNWEKIEELGYEPKMNFEDGIKKTLTWFRQNK
jgi:dTDP-glucose 4,6-dehydratase